jgi:hypothetical protein
VFTECLAPLAIDIDKIAPRAKRVYREAGPDGLERAPNGDYLAALDLASGTWDVLIATEQTAQGPFEFRERFTIEADQP